MPDIQTDFLDDWLSVAPFELYRRGFPLRRPGLTPQIRDDHAPYIAGWLEVLKNDKRVIFTAASHALTGLQPQQEQQEAQQAA